MGDERRPSLLIDDTVLVTGPAFEPLIGPTLDELVAIGPTWLVPGHCTGWRATHELARRLPDAFVQTSVGTRLRFE